MLVTVALSARIGPLERAVGQDRLIAWHRRLGPWGLYLLLAHVALIVLGYAGLAQTGVLAQLWELILTYPGMLAAAVATVLLAIAGVTSYKRARRRFRYETWWSIHLYTYLALLFAFSHEVNNGASFVGHPLETLWWTTIWVALLAAVVFWRIVLPVYRSLRHRIVVLDVVRESPDVVSVVLGGRRLDRLPVAGGQFFQWRFLTPGMWWQAHPYSLSRAPDSNHLRITVKNLGDHSAALANLKPGTPVAIEGPYGTFTPDARRSDKLLLVGAGVGSAPILAILQDLPMGTDVVVLLRASCREELILRDEIAAEVRRRAGRLLELPGSRHDCPLDASALRALITDVRRRDAYVCGPETFTASLAEALTQTGVPSARIHFESFAF
jgi:predicted ferric reductase